MKKLLSILMLLILVKGVSGQSVQASIKPDAMDSNVVVITLNPSATVTTRVSGVSLTIGIPVSDAGLVNPPIVIQNMANTSIAWVWQFVGSQVVGGVSHYIYDFQGTGNVSLPADDRTYTTAMDNEIVRVRIAGDATKRAKIKLVSFPDFGPSGNSNFGLSFNGTDVANVSNPFYSIPTISLAVNSTSNESVVETTGLRVLPVKFLGFTVTKNNNAAILNWSVESEDAKTDKYEILRSVNGTDFTTVATIAAKNNGLSANAYSFTQENLSNIRNTGVIYFRIKQIDKDGKAVITEIRNVRLTSKGLTIGVYPNPIKHSTNVSFDLEKDAEVILTLNDAGGKQLMINQFNGFKGSNIRSLDLSKFATGNYILKLQTSTDVNTLPIIKANN